MEKHFALQTDTGVFGMVTGDSLCEASTFSFEEKLEVTRVALNVADKRIPVLANVSETRTANALRFVEEAAKMGVQGFMVMPSVLYAADSREAKDNIRAIAKAAQLPIMIYHNPVTYKVDLSPEDVQDLTDCEWITAIKKSTDNIRGVTDLKIGVGDRFQIFMGVDDLSYEGPTVEPDGLLAGLVVAFPKETVALYNLMQAKRDDEALALYRWFMSLLGLDVSTKLVQNLKLVDTLAGVGNEFVRRPGQPLVGAQRERVTAIVRKTLDKLTDLSAYL